MASAARLGLKLSLIDHDRMDTRRSAWPRLLGWDLQTKETLKIMLVVEQ